MAGLFVRGLASDANEELTEAYKQFHDMMQRELQVVQYATLASLQQSQEYSLAAQSSSNKAAMISERLEQKADSLASDASKTHHVVQGIAATCALNTVL